MKIDLVDNVPIVTQAILVPAQVDPIIYAHDLLIGTTTNFYAIFDDDDWNTIYDEILMKDHPVDYINSLGLKNPNINLTDQDWTDILNWSAKNYMPWTKSGYSFLMHIVNKQVVYANINEDGTTNMPYANATEDIEELVSGDSNENDFILTNNQFANLMYSYNYDQKNWNEIKSKNNPPENNANDYFYDNSINNRFWIDDSITKEQILVEINNINNAIYIPNSLQDPKAKSTFTFSQFVEISTSKENILNIPSNIGIDGVKK